MSEDILELPQDPFPDVAMTQTFDTNFAAHFDASKPQNGLPWQLFPHPAFPWLSQGNTESSSDTSDGRSVLFEAPTNGGATGPLRVTPQEPFRQTNINGEMSCILWPIDWERIGVPDLVALEREAGVTFARFQSVATPTQSLDECRAVGNDFRIVAADRAAGTITLEGHGYYRQRPSSAQNPDGTPVYDIGPYVGLNRFDRDQLDTDAEPDLDDFKRHTHALTSFQLGSRYVLVNRIEDQPQRDQPSVSGVTSRHVLHVPAGVPDELTDARINGEDGAWLTMHRRLPYCSAMLTTASTFSQQYGVWDTRLRLERKREQFSSIFLWSHYLESSVRRYDKASKEVEIDVPEYPGGTLLFSNVHRPTGATIEANRMDTRGWSRRSRDENRLSPDAAAAAGLDFTDWFDIRTVFWPPGNLAGKPANWCERYLRMADGEYRLLCGEPMSPDAYDGVLDNLQIFLCNPVGGNFVSGAVHDYAKSRAPTGPASEALPIRMDVAHVKAWQLPGQIAGGAGLPAPNGTYPNGMARTPTQDHVPGNASGLIPGGAAPPGGPDAPPTARAIIVGRYADVGRRDDGGLLLLPEAT